MVSAAEDGGDTGLEPSVRRPWRPMGALGAEGRGAWAGAAPGERKREEGQQDFVSWARGSGRMQRSHLVLEPRERGAGDASGYSKGAGGGAVSGERVRD